MEFKQPKYYSDLDVDFIDSHKLCHYTLERWLARLLFNDDLDRVVYCSSDVAFRRRTEMVNKSKIKDGIALQNLDLPFAATYVEPQLQFDDRAGSVNAKQILIGIDEDDTKTRAAAVKYTANADLFFFSLSDCKRAQAILFQEASPRGRSRLNMYVGWNNHILGIPCNLTIESVTMDAYKESDFLNKMHIYSLRVRFTFRTYNVYIPHTLGFSLPQRFYYYQEENTTYNFTYDVELGWLSRKFGMSLIDAYNAGFVEDTLHVTAGYDEPDDTIRASIYQVESTPTSATMAIEDLENVTRMSYLFRGKWHQIDLDEEYEDSSEDSDSDSSDSICRCTLDNLEPGSTYNLVITAFTENATTKTYKVRLTTDAIENDPTPTPEKINAETPKLISKTVTTPENLEYSTLEGLTL